MFRLARRVQINTQGMKETSSREKLHATLHTRAPILRAAYVCTAHVHTQSIRAVCKTSYAFARAHAPYIVHTIMIAAHCMTLLNCVHRLFRCVLVPAGYMDFAKVAVVRCKTDSYFPILRKSMLSPESTMMVLTQQWPNI